MNNAYSYIIASYVDYMSYNNVIQIYRLHIAGFGFLLSIAPTVNILSTVYVESQRQNLTTFKNNFLAFVLFTNFYNNNTYNI